MDTVRFQPIQPVGGGGGGGGVRMYVNFYYKGEGGEGGRHSVQKGEGGGGGGGETLMYAFTDYELHCWVVIDSFWSYI